MVTVLEVLSDLLYTDGVLCVLSAAMAHQVGAVDPVDEFSLCLEPLHGPCKPATHQANINLTHLKLWNDTWGYRLSAYHCVVYCPLQSVYLLTLPVFTRTSCLCLFCELTKVEWSNRRASAPGAESKSRRVLLLINLNTTLQ